MGKHTGDLKRGAVSTPALQPNQEPELNPADGFAFLTKLPGVVVYQRLVTPDEQIRYTYISEGARDLFGVSAEEILSDPQALFSCHSAEYSAMFRERLLAASKALTAWDVEASIISRDGRKKYTHAIAQPERRPDGSVLWTGIILDETRTRTGIVEGLSQGFLLYDTDDRLIMRNSHFLDLFPSIRNVVVPGARYEDVIRAKLRAEDGSLGLNAEEQVRQLMEQHCKPRTTFEQQLDDGRWVLVNEQRTEEGTVVVYTDITQLKHSENQVRAKSSFLAVMSHEIRTPMNAVLGFTNMLMESNLDPEQRSSVAAIYNAGDALLTILNDILDFSKLESGQLSLEEIAFSPTSIVHNVVSILGPRASDKGLPIRIVEDPVLPAALLGDAGRIRQILLNLVSNAIKFTDSGEVVISVRYLRQEEARATVEWSVSDSGMGIPTDRIKDLFKDFTQVDSSISRRFGGSGLGLAICKRLVEQMGGEIGVISALGRGSSFRFSVTLPLAEKPAQIEQDDNESYANFTTCIAGLGHPLRILLTDDDATNRLVAAKMLKDFDVQINMACNGVEVVEAVTHFRCDVILMDMRMPEMDGLQATRAIRAKGGWLASVPIIAFTANAFAEDVKACQDAGMNDFVVKPVRKKVLIGTIARALMRAAPAIPAEGGTVEAPPLAPGEAEAGPAGEAVPDPDAGDCAYPLMDRAVYHELVQEIGEESISEMLDVFVNETVAQIALLRRLCCPNDGPQIARVAHSLKSTSGAFGLKRLSALARTLEAGASGMSDPEFRAARDRIERGFDAARSQLPAQLDPAR
jgi:signal transduction histidine kinase/DNA-binding response OmpR family regulator/HPt (histidine-containing phosphotransfer) domain-containing protein